MTTKMELELMQQIINSNAEFDTITAMEQARLDHCQAEARRDAARYAAEEKQYQAEIERITALRNDFCNDAQKLAGQVFELTRWHENDAQLINKLDELDEENRIEIDRLKRVLCDTLAKLSNKRAECTALYEDKGDDVKAVNEANARCSDVARIRAEVIAEMDKHITEYDRGLLTEVDLINKLRTLRNTSKDDL